MKKSMGLNNIKMISFDLFGVIITEGHLISNVLLPLLPSSSQKPRVKSLYNQYNLNEITETDFWNGIGVQDNQLLRSVFLSRFQLDPDFRITIDQLLKNYNLSILSNLPPDWAKALSKKFEFEEIFNPCLFSGLTGCKKPQPEIYNLLIAKSGIPAHQIAFIDDRLENLQTAHELGMTTIYYQREHELHTFRPGFRINKLGELLAIMNSAQLSNPEH